MPVTEAMQRAAKRMATETMLKASLPQAKTAPANVAKIEKLADALAEPMTRLWWRWKDENEYEKIADYGDVIKPLLPVEFEFVKMTARPFALHFSLDGQHGYQIYVDSRGGGWRRAVK